MKLIHIELADQRKYQHLLLIAVVLLVTILPATATEAHIVDWPCSRSAEIEPTAKVTPCGLGLVATWREYKRADETSPKRSEESSSNVPSVFQYIRRGVLFLRFVACATTEFVSDLLEHTFGNSEMSRKDH